KKKRLVPKASKKKSGNEVDLFSTLSHEIRTPLTSISGYIKLLLGEGAGHLSEIQKDYLGIVDKNVDRLTELINEILDYQVMESGKIPLTKRILHLGPVLKECCDTFSLLASQKGLSLEFVLPQKIRPVFGDRSRLVQIFMNLISNAIKFTQVGSIKVEVSDGRGGILVVIKDTGVGLTSSEKTKLFKKFFRADSGLSNPERGTGLGLVITQGLVKSHGGKISVKSEKGKGTSFSVVLPAALAAAD
ncbi:MAG: HAMP domain-containing sensor histidine kinase, partial [Bdellovibrionia bacterium]